MQELFQKLASPFDPSKVSWRVGAVNGNKGMALAYIDARDVMQRLDDVCGPENWQCRYSHADHSSFSYSEKEKDNRGKPIILAETLGKTVCEIGILCNGQWIWKSDGAGDSATEAEKGALSDAFKRAAVRWGIGRYLYDLDAPWVEIDQYKRITDVALMMLAERLQKTGLKQHTLSGQAKKPAKFWDYDKLTIGLSNQFPATVSGEWSKEAKDWWYKRFMEAVDKAPTIEKLMQLQIDNTHIMDGQFKAEQTFQLHEACRIRAEQFSQLGG